MTILSTNTSKGEIRYAKLCSGPRPLIMLPGISITSVLGVAADVELAYQAFDSKYTIYLFEYPSKYPDDADIKYISDILVEAIRSLKLEKCYLLGASMGGMVGQIMLAEYPELFVSAVFGSPIAKLSEASPNTISKWHTFALNEDIRILNLTFYDAVYSDEYQIQFAEPIRKALDNGDKQGCMLMATFTQMILQADIREYTKKINTPTLVLGSKLDRVFSYKDIEEVANLIGCESIFYENCGHAVIDEVPEMGQKILEYYDKTSI